VSLEERRKGRKRKEGYPKSEKAAETLTNIKKEDRRVFDRINYRGCLRREPVEGGWGKTAGATDVTVKLVRTAQNIASTSVQVG